MRPTHIVLAVLAGAALAGAALAGPARADGPPAVGGEETATFVAAPGHGARVELSVPPGSLRLDAVWLRATATCRTGGRAARVIRHISITHRPIVIDAHHRATSTGDADDRPYHLRFRVRFDKGWTRATGSFSERWRNSAGAACAIGTVRFTARRVTPDGTFPLGAYRGTTTQGRPLTFVAVRATDLRWVARDLATTVLAACEDGRVVTVALRADPVGGAPELAAALDLPVVGTVAGWPGVTPVGELTGRLTPQGAAAGTLTDLSFTLPIGSPDVAELPCEVAGVGWSAQHG